MERVQVIIRENDSNDTEHKILLTQSQLKFLEWMKEKNLIWDEVTFTILGADDFTPIE